MKVKMRKGYKMHSHLKAVAQVKGIFKIVSFEFFIKARGGRIEFQRVRSSNGEGSVAPGTCT